ncbi:MAG: hypothetical protein IT324_15775 [Anaerolineae bacterium]|nr:hypothetical protein [Anaerolineae bacterium]
MFALIVSLLVAITFFSTPITCASIIGTAVMARTKQHPVQQGKLIRYTLLTLGAGLLLATAGVFHLLFGWRVFIAF